MGGGLRLRSFGSGRGGVRWGGGMLLSGMSWCKRWVFLGGEVGDWAAWKDVKRGESLGGWKCFGEPSECFGFRFFISLFFFFFGFFSPPKCFRAKLHPIGGVLFFLTMGLKVERSVGMARKFIRIISGFLSCLFSHTLPLTQS